ncbi:hypothetical protein CONPUDRAFT_93967 [Coniophora puteana RWD-64-598 SS2]|uniref:Uncharacterized protein n=1 Tax=Coniophora puteana (strain RWD-64-598) TaxID=741705 RepID=R7SDC6_CONPW|nr:uncharacterized protein CONPUDRAFT_93967 [Coniophora puteana RWD-64-598 SS2]EIW74166.1 hypothetical protein CONPUDRAFT_93967 [Coniophora puteana RWD-64-598 SS2]
MGKVTTFCIISGRTPEMAGNLRNLFKYMYFRNSDAPKPGELVLQALNELADAEGLGVGDEDVTLIGLPREDALHIPKHQIHVVPHCSMSEQYLWDLGFANGPKCRAQNGEEVTPNFLVSFGPIIMVQTSGLPILHLATCGRVSPLRLWTLAMHLGWSKPHNDYGLPGVDYGEVGIHREQDPPPIPYMEEHEVVALEELGNVEAIQETVAQLGGFWVWMRPDRFPLDAPSVHDSTPHSGGHSSPSLLSGRQAVKKLPFELFCMIALEGPLPSMISLAATSRFMHSILLGSTADRNTLAAAWLQTRAPWYIPSTPDVEGAQLEMHKLHEGGAWEYLRRCHLSASMRNRRRIWQVAERIERLADAYQI